jgi:Ca2+-binding EF-hand superfamily protein
MRTLSLLMTTAITIASVTGIVSGQPRGRGNPVERIKALDKNKDGKITKAEATGPFARMFSRVDANNDGVIDEAELKRMSSRFGGGRPGASGGVEEGKPAPDFHLKTVDGKNEVKLSSFTGKNPVALIFGSYT